MAEEAKLMEGETMPLEGCPVGALYTDLLFASVERSHFPFAQIAFGIQTRLSLNLRLEEVT